MKLGIFAASALVGVVSFAAATFAQGDRPVQEVSRTPRPTEGGVTLNRVVPPTGTPTLVGNRPVAGMLPPSGPVRGFEGTPSSRQAESSDIRRSLSRD